MASQCTSPFRSRKAYWSIVRTIESARWGADQRFITAPYHAVIPTFGTWGFVIAATKRLDPKNIHVTVPTRFIRSDSVGALFAFPPDMARIDAPITSFDDPAVVRLYRAGYHRYLD